MFILLLSVITLWLASTAAYFSIVGLASLFSFHYWGAVIMGSSLESGKLIAISFLYRYWKTTNLIRKGLMSLLVIALIVLTSIGIFGYLMQGYQEGSSNKQIISVKLQTNETELNRVNSRLQDIETQIAKLPSNSVKGRIALEKNYRLESNKLKEDLNKLLVEQKELRINGLEADAHLGPIVYIAKELNVDPSTAATYLVILIVSIFDPLTVLLTISINQVINEKSRSNDVRPGPTERGTGEGPGLGRVRRRRGIRTRNSIFSPKEEIKAFEAETIENAEEPKLELKEPKSTAIHVSPRKVIGASGKDLIYE